MRASRAGVLRAAGAALVAFALTTALALAVGAQLAPGWRPGAAPHALEPAPLATLPACGAPTEVVELPGSPVPASLARPTEVEARPDVAVVLVAGAGPGGRDRLREQAEQLAACGIPAVSYDKPAGLLRRDFDAWGAVAGEVATATREATGAGRIGVVGWSEGGWVAARVLDQVDMVVTMGAPVVTPTEQLAWQADSALAGAPEALRRVPAALLSRPAGPRWTRDDVRPLLSGSAVPHLGVWGAQDGVVPVMAAVERLREALPTASVLVLPEGGHDLAGTPWAPHVAVWLREPAPSLTQGVQPAQQHGIPTLPEPTLATHPLVHLTLALIAALTAGTLARRPSRRPR